MILGIMSQNDVRVVQTWLESDEFLQTCADAGACPEAVKSKFDELTCKGLDMALSY